MNVDLYGLSTTQIAEKFDLLVEERDHYKRELGLSHSTDTIARLCERWSLTKTEARMLAALHAKRGRPMTKAGLMDALYAGRDEPEIRIIDVYVCKLRRKMGAASSAYIETIWGVGFCLNPAGVELVDAALLVGRC